MLTRTLAATLLLALPATAQVAAPTLAPPSGDLLARPDTYPGSDIELPVAAAPGFRPAVPGCIGPGLPTSGYGNVPACYAPDGRSEPRPGIVVVPLE